MVKPNHSLKQLRGALKLKSRKLDGDGYVGLLKSLNLVEHFIVVKNHKKAHRQLEDFTRQLVELLSSD